MWGLLSKRIRWNPLSESEKVRHAFLFEYIIISDQFSNLPLLFSFFLLLNLFVKHKQLFFKTCWSWGSIYPEHEGLVLKTDGEWTYKSKLFFIRFKSFCSVFSFILLSSSSTFNVVLYSSRSNLSHSENQNILSFSVLHHNWICIHLHCIF